MYVYVCMYIYIYICLECISSHDDMVWNGHDDTARARHVDACRLPLACLVFSFLASLAWKVGLTINNVSV